jgi:hypothetical protein
MGPLPESHVAALCETRLALIAETAGNFKAQLLDLTKLRDLVRKQNISLKFGARTSAHRFARTEPLCFSLMR